MVTNTMSQSVHWAVPVGSDGDVGASDDHVPTPPRTVGRALPGGGGADWVGEPAAAGCAAGG